MSILGSLFGIKCAGLLFIYTCLFFLNMFILLTLVFIVEFMFSFAFTVLQTIVFI